MPLFPASLLLQSDDGSTIGALFALLFGGVGFLIMLAIAALTIVGMWKMFTKAGKPGWASLIPIYNIVVLGQIAGWEGSKIILLFIPVLNIVFGIMLMLDLAKAYGKESGFAVGMVILPMVFFPIIGFDSSVYQGAARQH